MCVDSNKQARELMSLYHDPNDYSKDWELVPKKWNPPDFVAPLELEVTEDGGQHEDPFLMSDVMSFMHTY
jgi:hypothetical protein